MWPLLSVATGLPGNPVHSVGPNVRVSQFVSHKLAQTSLVDWHGVEARIKRWSSNDLMPFERWHPRSHQNDSTQIILV